MVHEQCQVSLLPPPSEFALKGEGGRGGGANIIYIAYCKGDRQLILAGEGVGVQM